VAVGSQRLAQGEIDNFDLELFAGGVHVTANSQRFTQGEIDNFDVCV
jgi:hypothetical protein